jgi:DNA primase
MARIPEAEIERLKQEVSLVRLVEARGIALRPHGADLVGLCPFHDDHEPSLVVSKKKNLFHCLGACQTGGSVIDWVMKAEGVSFRHAVELLRTNAAPSTTNKIAKKSSITKIAAPIAADVEDQKLLAQVVTFYQRTLEESPEALDYLKQRGLVHEDLIDFFQLGFANRTLGYRLPQANRQAGAEIRGRLQSLGILRTSGHEHFNGSLVVPVFGEDGTVAEIYGRKITPHLRTGTPLHLYLPGPHGGVFNWQGLTAGEDVILCEALIDAMTFWCAGFKNVTSSFGVEGFTDAHREAFLRYGIKRVLIAYDRDDAGDAAAEKLAPILAADGMAVYRILFPKGMDANEYALKMSPAPRALELVIRKATWMAGVQHASFLPKPSQDNLQNNSSAEALHSEVEAEAERAQDLFDAECSIADVPMELTLAHPPPTERPEAAESPQDNLQTETHAEPPIPDAPAHLAHDEPITGHPRAMAQLQYNLHSAAENKPPASAPSMLQIAPGGVEPTAPRVNMDVLTHEVVFRFGDRRVRVRGLDKNKSYDVLKINLLLARGDRSFIDNLDLYHARQRVLFLKQAAAELELPENLLKHDLQRVLFALEEIQDKAIAESTKPKVTEVVLSPEEHEAAIALLRDPHLLDRIVADFHKLGVVGEQTNKLVGYLATISRMLDRPLAVLVQSSSAAGKSSLMEAVLSLVPEEHRVKYSAMTGQSLYYLGETDLKHKILAIVEEEGAERASYALKLLQSEGELTIASTGKDPETGKLLTNEYRVEGPVMIFLTTTAVEVDEELLNRCLVLTVDEGKEQTQAIHQTQRKSRTLEGLLGRRDRVKLQKLHQNAQRLLRRLPVVNPHAERLTFGAHSTRMRRDHLKYLTLIDTIALLHQYQRPIQRTIHHGEPIEYIEVTEEDIALANRLTRHVLGRTLDELPPQTRRLLGLLDEMVKKACHELAIERSEYRFSRRQIREHTRLGQSQVHLHITRLVEMEYLIVHRGMRGQSYVYELAFDPAADGSLPASDSIGASATTESFRGLEPSFRGEGPDLSAPFRPQFGPNLGGFRSDEIQLSDLLPNEKQGNGKIDTHRHRSGDGRPAGTVVRD